MEFFSGQFFAALLSIIVIDLVLAGDNAIVIALAARNLSENVRGRAIVWGTVGAIVVRSLLTLAVVWLLKIPGLLLIGGALLIWIAYKLLVDNGDGNGHRDPADGFWPAMKTIVLADALMGMDNVLAVAGAAHGSFLLVVTGLVISIPIVIWGSRLVLKLLHRFPAIVYVGAAVLGWTSARMMTNEPMLGDWLAGRPTVAIAVHAAVISGVLGAGFIVNHRRIRERVARFVVDTSVAPAGAHSGKGASVMKKVLVPVDGSPNSLKALRHVVDGARKDDSLEIHVVHVRAPFSRYIARFLSKRSRAAYHRDEAGKALKPARELLETALIPHATHVELGDAAQAIDRVARRLHVDRIVMGTARKNSFTRMIEDSVTNRVVELAQVPVEVIAGQSVSRLERIGIPAGIGMALVLLFAAID
jgi:YjbE family integral membrane protein